MVAVNEKLRPGAEPKGLPVGNYYLLQDTLHRAVALTDSSGAVVEAYDCDAYGNTIAFTAADSSGNWWSDSATQSSLGANDIIYCGYRLDPETENYYVRNRYHSPVLGRWLTRDPIGYQGGINLYEYAGGDPAGNVDPRGLQVYLGPGSGWGDNGSPPAGINRPPRPMPPVRPAHVVIPLQPRAICNRLLQQLSDAYAKRGRVGTRLGRLQAARDFEKIAGDALTPYSQAWLSQMYEQQKFDSEWNAVDKEIAETDRLIALNGCRTACLPDPQRHSQPKGNGPSERQKHLLEGASEIPVALQIYAEAVDAGYFVFVIVGAP